MNDYKSPAPKMIEELEISNKILKEIIEQRELQIQEMTAYLIDKNLIQDYLEWSK